MSKPAIVREHSAYVWAAYAWAVVFLIAGGLLVASSFQLAGPEEAEFTVQADATP